MLALILKAFSYYCLCSVCVSACVRSHLCLLGTNALETCVCVCMNVCVCFRCFVAFCVDLRRASTVSNDDNYHSPRSASVDRAMTWNSMLDGLIEVNCFILKCYAMRSPAICGQSKSGPGLYMRSSTVKG